MLKIIKSVLSVIFQARILFILFYFCAFVTFAPMASILGAEMSQMTLSALFNPLTILSCALLAVYIGFRVAAYKNHGIDCKMDAIFFIALSWIFFMEPGRASWVTNTTKCANARTPARISRNLYSRKRCKFRN